MEPTNRQLLDEQLEYYRCRAPEYDEWFLRLGRYDRGERHRRRWQAEVARVEAALAAARPRGRVLELACGTGLWTRRLVETADSVTAVDASREVLALNRRRLAQRDAAAPPPPPSPVHYVCADLFEWRPAAAAFDFIFFAFWLSHVPPPRFDAFWSGVRGGLRPGGRAFFVDSLRNPESGAAGQPPPPAGGWLTERVLNDGRRFRVVKVFYEPADLRARLERRGWRGSVRASGQFFLYGTVEPA